MDNTKNKPEPTKVLEMPEETWHGVPRSKIPWYPIVDYEKCISCRKCVEHCTLGTFRFEEKGDKKRPIVKNPNNCVVLCTGCDGICPVGAIEHQFKKETREIIRKLRNKYSLSHYVREVKAVLFVCVENAGRSQMAEAFAHKYGKDKFIVSSAGNKPADRVNPVVVEAMKEKSIDVSMNKPKLLTYQTAQDADLIITKGCDDQGICPGPFFKPTIDWKLDPKGKTIEEIREIRDEIERLVQKLIEEN